ncbi:MAG: thrombospondin type 3 repeat-containing protein [Rudanella sp.]|nr:thrombospondin type 3 repeat-containing protein [Rudanella sp.]
MALFFHLLRRCRWLLFVLLSPGWVLPSGAAAQTTPPCDYSTATVTLNSVGGSGGGTVRYLLTDETGLIRQVSSTPTFTGLSGSRSYTALVISHDGTATGLTAGGALSAVSSTCYNWSEALILRVCVGNDEDGDGVTDEQDRCPGTPLGTPVNAYGCPKTRTTCDYSTTSVTLNSLGGTGNGTVRYALADSVGTIVQVSATPMFGGLTGSHTYMALAISHDGSVTGLTVGQSLSAVSANCYDWSDALVIRVCVGNDEDVDGVIDLLDRCPGTPGGTPVNAYGCPKNLTTCDYATSTVSLSTSGGAGNGTVQYVLADSVGTILQVNPSATFAGLTGSRTYMALSINHDGSATGLTVGQALSAVSANCYDWSDAVVFKDCVPSATCDYTVGTPITLQSVGGTTTPGTLTRYVLVNPAGLIVQVTNAPSFATAGLAGGLYTAYGMVYTDDGSVSNLETGRLFARVQANCIALSAPIRLSLCVPCVPRCVPITVTRPINR